MESFRASDIKTLLKDTSKALDQVGSSSVEALNVANPETLRNVRVV